METITGIKNLQDEWRKLKLKVGDLRGMKNRFNISQKLGVPALQTFFYSMGGNGKERMEVWADISYDENSTGWRVYNMKDLLQEVKEAKEKNHSCLYIQLGYIKWNEHRTDGDHINGKEFIFKLK